MKNVFRSVVAVVMMGLAAISCQNDSGSTSQELSKNSPLTTMLMKVTHNGGSPAGKTTSTIAQFSDEGNFPCFVVNLPVTLLIDGQTVVITSLDDYSDIRDALHQCGDDDDDDDQASFVFPISLTFADGTVVTVNTEEELRAAVQSCSDSADDIECLDLHYPITIAYTDSANVTTSVTFDNDEEVYLFLVTLGTDETLVINYPVTITDASGATVVINSNEEFLDAIQEADDHCGNHDGDDDDDQGEDEDDD